MTETVRVELLGVPVDLQGRASAHTDALQREFEMISREDSGVGADHVPIRLRNLVQELRERFGGLADHADEILHQARERGDARVDLAYEVPPEVVEASRQLRDLLAEADDYCRAGDLMTLASPDDVVLFREWFLNEFIRQVNGFEPTPWSAVAPDDDGDALDDTADPPGWDLTTEGSTVRIRFIGELDLESAPHLRTLVANAAQAPDLSTLVIDLSDVTFLDSVGLSVLLTVRMRLLSDEIAVEVVPSSSVERVFTLAGVSDLFAT